MTCTSADMRENNALGAKLTRDSQPVLRLVTEAGVDEQDPHPTLRIAGGRRDARWSRPRSNGADEIVADPGERRSGSCFANPNFQIERGCTSREGRDGRSGGG